MDQLTAFLDLVPHLLRGARLTLLITLAAAALAFVLSFVVAFARMSQYRAVRMFFAAYVEVFRGTSAIVQLFFFFYILPAYGIRLEPITTAIFTLGLNLSAYGSEVVRGALGAIEEGQHDAAAALGLSRVLTWRLVIVPQAFVMMLPPFGNLLVELLKATSLVSLITITELTFSGRQMVVTTGRDLEVWGLVLVLYFAMAFPLSLLARRAEVYAARFRA